MTLPALRPSAPQKQQARATAIYAARRRQIEKIDATPSLTHAVRPLPTMMNMRADMRVRSSQCVAAAHLLSVKRHAITSRRQQSIS